MSSKPFLFLLIAAGAAAIALSVIAPRGGLSNLELLLGCVVIAGAIIRLKLAVHAGKHKDNLSSLPWIKAAAEARKNGDDGSER